MSSTPNASIFPTHSMRCKAKVYSLYPVEKFKFLHLRN